jgi:hypothetical protein
MKLKLARFSGVACVLSFLVFAASCAPQSSPTDSTTSSTAANQIVGNSPTDSANNQTRTSSPSIDGTPIPTAPNTNMRPLSWEGTVKDSNLWSAYIYSVISLEEPQMLADDAALDTNLFCPRYKQLNKTQRLNFWGQLFSAMAYYESGWKPTSRMVEAMEADAVTGRTIASEGLLQVSYQDSKFYGQTSCDFNWSKDKSLSSSDVRKTIFDPYKNLHCAIRIMASQLKRKQLISFDSGIYWAVIKKGSRYNHISQISSATKALSFCTSAN